MAWVTARTCPDQGGKTIMFAPWPKPLDEDFVAHYGLDDYDGDGRCQVRTGSQGRNLRREANMPSGKKVSFVLKPTGAMPQQDVEGI